MVNFYLLLKFTPHDSAYPGRGDNNRHDAGASEIRNTVGSQSIVLRPISRPTQLLRLCHYRPSPFQSIVKLDFLRVYKTARGLCRRGFLLRKDTLTVLAFFLIYIGGSYKLVQLLSKLASLSTVFTMFSRFSFRARRSTGVDDEDRVPILPASAAEFGRTRTAPTAAPHCTGPSSATSNVTVRVGARYGRVEAMHKQRASPHPSARAHEDRFEEIVVWIGVAALMTPKDWAMLKALELDPAHPDYWEGWRQVSVVRPDSPSTQVMAAASETRVLAATRPPLRRFNALHATAFGESVAEVEEKQVLLPTRPPLWRFNALDASAFEEAIADADDAMVPPPTPPGTVEPASKSKANSILIQSRLKGYLCLKVPYVDETVAVMASDSDTVSTISLYAELLFHIRAVSFIASLQTNSSKTTRAELSADGEHINLTHDGEVATIRLPTKIAGGGSAALTLPAVPSKELTLRLQLEERSPGLLRIDGGSANVVPWCASSLNEGTRVHCRECQSVLLGPQRVSEWKDLPSESWAEMMDFWHCHKPNVEHPVGDEDAQGRKGYAASSHLIMPNVPETTRPLQLVCSKCRAVVGIVDERAEGWRIYKWATSVNANCSRAPTPHDITKWLSAQLLALVDSQGVRKFVVHDAEECEGARKSSLKLWVFTPDLRFSSSYLIKSRKEPTRAMKVFWQPLSPRSEHQSHGALTQENLSVEEIELPFKAFRTLTQRLEFTARLLPLSARKLQEWNVGLLERFDEHEDYASITMSLNIKKLLAWIQKHAEQNVRVRASDPAKERLHAWRNSYVYGMPWADKGGTGSRGGSQHRVAPQRP
ncbi:hypothetical protein B0A49_09871 [Cryomyces minteri]|uniref:Ubiquitin-conjugating enzyme E2C-binding protein n=1 Tax=Cryomyces minteri TaxID=331657 RepID=A0A4U0WM60_9PEZI|nr:hypothetical protein B0A49_09871 [Cryomyces minteri]